MSKIDRCFLEKLAEKSEEKFKLAKSAVFSRSVPTFDTSLGFSMLSDDSASEIAKGGVKTFRLFPLVSLLGVFVSLFLSEVTASYKNEMSLKKTKDIQYKLQFPANNKKQDPTFFCLPSTLPLVIKIWLNLVPC